MKGKLETVTWTLNRTSINGIAILSPEGTAAHFMIENWSTTYAMFFSGSPFYLFWSWTEAILISTTPQVQGKLAMGKMQASLCWALIFLLSAPFFTVPPPSYSTQCSWLKLLPNPTWSFPCSPAGGSPFAWWTCLPPSPPVCHIPPADIWSGYTVSLAHNRSPLLVGVSPQCGQSLEGRKQEGCSILPTK